MIPPIPPNNAAAMTKIDRRSDPFMGVSDRIHTIAAISISQHIVPIVRSERYVRSGAIIPRFFRMKTTALCNTIITTLETMPATAKTFKTSIATPSMTRPSYHSKIYYTILNQYINVRYNRNNENYLCPSQPWQYIYTYPS